MKCTLRNITVAVGAVWLMGAAIASATTFTRITTGDLVTIPANYWNGSWGDYDDDGYIDLFVGATSPSKRNFLYHNNRDGTFNRIDAAKMPKSLSNQQSAVWADYDNDGHLDLITTAGNYNATHDILYHNNGDGTLSGITEGPINSGLSIARGASWGDYDNDGFVDVFITGLTNELFHNSGDGRFTQITSSDPGAGVLLTDLGITERGTWVDYDNDGDLDVLVTHDAPSTNALYRNDGTGRFASVADSGLTDRIEESVGACWADYDNDGLLDLFLANYVVNSLYHNNGDGSFTNMADSAVVADTVPPEALFTSCAWGDYDNDGFIDLFVTVGAFSDGPPRSHNFLYHNSGDGTFTPVTDGQVVTDLTTECPGASWGDYDNDGSLDLFVSQGAFWPTPQANLLYHNDGNSNAWLNVNLVGSVSNRSAIGAKVRVNAIYRGASRWQVREISGGDGLSNQQSLNAEFGLADATTIDTLRVEWPSGVVQELQNVAPRQFLTITEPLCNGDCGSDGQVASDEVLALVGIALGDAQHPACPHGVASGVEVDVALIIQAVNNARNQCPGAVAHITKVGTEPASSAAGQPLADPIIVQVTDAGGHSVAGVSVSFAVQAGGGTVEPAFAVTNANGRATAQWTLGIAPVDNRLRASAAAESVSFAVRATLAAPLQPARFGDVNGFIESHLDDQCLEAVGDSECSTYALAFDGKGHLLLGIPGGLLEMDVAGNVSAVPLSGESIIDPQGIAFDQDGNLWVADLGGPIRAPLEPLRALRVVSPAGVVSTALVEPLLSPTSVAVDAAGRVYVSDPCLGEILRYDPHTAAVDAVLSFSVAAQGGPSGFALDPGTGRIVVLTGPIGTNCGGTNDTVGSIYAASVSEAGFGVIEPLIDRFPGTIYPFRFGQGAAFDREGNLYATFGEFTGDLLYSTLWVLPRGSREPVRFLASPAPNPRILAQPAFGQGEFGESTLYIALTLRGQAPPDARGVDRFAVGIPGAPVPPVSGAE